MENKLVLVAILVLMFQTSFSQEIMRLQNEVEIATEITPIYPDSALLILSNIEEDVIYSKDDDLIAELYRRKGNCYFYTSDYKLAQDEYFKALKIRRSGGIQASDSINKSEIGNLYYNIAITSEFLSDYVQAIDYTQKLESIYKSIKDYPKLSFRAYGYSGKLYYYLGDFENALYYSYKETEISKQMKDTVGVSYSLDFQAMIKQDMDLHNEALELQLESLALREELQDSMLISYSFNNIGASYLKLENFEKALEYFDKSLAIKLLYDIKGVEATYNNMGIALQKMGDYKSSEEYYLMSYEYCVARNLMFGKGTAVINLGVISNLLGKTTIAEKYFNEAYNLALNNGYKNLMIDATAFSQEFYAEHGRFEEAHEMLNLNVIYNDSVKNDGVIKEIARLEAEHEFHQKQVADSIVRHQQKIHDDAIYDEEIIRKEQLIWILAITFLFIIFVIFILFKAYQLRRRNQENYLKQKTLEIEKNLLRTQMNPHFIFNAMNSIQSFIATNDSYSAERYLSKFAKLIRLILENSMHQTIVLSEEILSLQLYLDLEKVRFNSKFDFTIDIDDEVEDEMINVPPMLIQPFVENAIIHGIMHKIGTGNITISIVESDMPKTLKCEIVDDGIGRKASKNLKLNNHGKKHKSVGMQLTRERLEALNSQTQPAMSYEIEDVCDKDKLIIGTKVTLYIPYFEHNI